MVSSQCAIALVWGGKSCLLKDRQVVDENACVCVSERVHHTPRRHPPCPPPALDTQTMAAQTSSCLRGSQKQPTRCHRFLCGSPRLCSPFAPLWRVIDSSWTPKTDVCARILWHVVVKSDVGARSSRSQFRRLLSSDLFWCRQTQWLAFPGGVGGGRKKSNARRLLDRRLGRRRMISRLSGFWSTCGCIFLCVTANILNSCCFCTRKPACHT